MTVREPSSLIIVRGCVPPADALVEKVLQARSDQAVAGENSIGEQLSGMPVSSH
jgi:hypothetical protein